MPVSEQQMNRILANIAENIPSDCSTGRRIHKGSTVPTVNLNGNDFNITDYEAYRNDIEFVNSFSEQVLADEATYFTAKYGRVVYDFLLAQRNEYILESNRATNVKLCLSCPKDASGSTVDASNCTNTNGQDKENEMFNFLEKYSPLQNADTTFKKIEYRDESHQFISKINNLLTKIYFCILFVMFVLLAMSKRLFLKERAVTYIFLIVLPFIFPYLFEMLKKVYKYYFPGSPSYGPKNAFLENREKATTVNKKNFYEQRERDASLNRVDVSGNLPIGYND